MFAGSVFSVIPGIVANEFLKPDLLVERRLGRRYLNGDTNSRITLWNNVNAKTSDYGIVDGTQIAYDGGSQKFETGLDYIAAQDETGVWTVGVSAKLRSVEVNLEDDVDSGSIEGLGFGLSTMAARDGFDGSYEAFQFEINTVNFSTSTKKQGELYSGMRTTVLFASFEKGHRFQINDNFSIAPHGQLTIGQIIGKKFESYNGIQAKFKGENVYNGRVGFSAEYRNKGFSAYATTNLQYDQLNVWDIDYAGRTFSDGIEDISADFGFGASLKVERNIDIFLRGSIRESFSGDSDQLGSSNISTGISFNW